MQKDPYLLNSSVYFDREGLGISYCKWRMNNYDMTPQLNVIACFGETKKCFNSKYKKVISLPSFESDFFANAIRLDDSSDMPKYFEWEVEINNKYPSMGGIPMLFCCYKNKL